MPDRNDVYAYLGFRGDFDPAEITSATGLRPTSCWRKGDAGPAPLVRRASDGWNLRSRTASDEPPEAHVADVLAQAAAAPAAIADAARRHSGRLVVVGYFAEGFPGFEITAQQTAAAAALGVGFEFDFYDLRER